MTTAISSRVLVDAVLRVERMTFEQRERLAEEIHAEQRNLFFSVLVLQRYGASLEQMEVVLNLLLVFYQAMKTSGKAWPVISEDVQERCLQRVSGRVGFIEGLTQQQQAQATSQAIADHPEQQLLAYVFGKFKEHGLLGIETETEKMLMLAALNLVECMRRQRRGQTAETADITERASFALAPPPSHGRSYPIPHILRPGQRRRRLTAYVGAINGCRGHTEAPPNNCHIRRLGWPKKCIWRPPCR